MDYCMAYLYNHNNTRGLWWLQCDGDGFIRKLTNVFRHSDLVSSVHFILHELVGSAGVFGQHQPSSSKIRCQRPYVVRHARLLCSAMG